MSQPGGGVRPFRVVYSGPCREQTRQLLARAAAKGQFAEIVQVIRDINNRLEWIPLDFGNPLRDLAHLGLQERFGTVPPLVVTYSVDEARRIVYITVPFQLLPNSGR